jgi:hypothetical protein
VYCSPECVSANWYSIHKSRCQASSQDQGSRAQDQGPGVSSSRTKAAFDLTQTLTVAAALPSDTLTPRSVPCGLRRLQRLQLILRDLSHEQLALLHQLRRCHLRWCWTRSRSGSRPCPWSLASLLLFRTPRPGQTRALRRLRHHLGVAVAQGLYLVY